MRKVGISKNTENPPIRHSLLKLGTNKQRSNETSSKMLLTFQYQLLVNSSSSPQNLQNG